MRTKGCWGVGAVLLGVAGCGAQGAGERSPSLTSADVTVAEPASAPAAPAAVKLTGTIKTLSPGYMPAAQNGGKTQGWVELFVDWTMDPPLPPGKTPKDVLSFNDTLSVATVTPALASTGKCVVTAGGLSGVGGFMITATEPGCDATKMLDEKLPAPVVVQTRAVWKATKTPVPVTISIAPRSK